MKTLTFCLALIVMSCTLAFGQTYKVLWSFGDNAGDGTLPVSSLVIDGEGNLYGTSQYGGSNNGGTVFELAPSSDGTWSESVLYNFCSNVENNLCLDGRWPTAGLVFDQAGNLYGTTSFGGAGLCGDICGIVFELSPPQVQGGEWTEVVLYSFCAGSFTKCQDGGLPLGQLTFDESGNLYGTTDGGGTGNGGNGTVFELSPSNNGWNHTTLYSFCLGGHNRVCPDGAQPQAGLTFDKMGNLYGTTMLGGVKNTRGSGTVFELTPMVNGWVHTTLIAFNQMGGNLQLPLGTVTFDPNGNLYSTASAGNSGVFELRRKAHTQRTFLFNGSNGYSPTSGVVLDLRAKALYGTTASSNSGNGVVYRIGASGQQTVLYNFCQQTNCADGQQPLGSLLEDASGNFYGTTRVGGANGQGVVFEITP